MQGSKDCLEVIPYRRTFRCYCYGFSFGSERLRQSRKKNEEEGQDSVPVGYETVIDMYPLDFEEFLWANGIGKAVIDSVKLCFESERLFPMEFTRQ